MGIPLPSSNRDITSSSTDQIRSSYSRSLKSVALTLVLCFSLQTVVQAAPDAIKPLNLGFFSKPAISFEIPESIALVDEVFGPGPVHPSNRVGPGLVSQKTLYLLQDAHTNESGQINISKTLDHVLHVWSYFGMI